MGRYRIFLLALTLAAAVWPLKLEARSLAIESFDADIVVNLDGSIQVTETIRPHFTGSWNGIYRTIPVEYRTPQGLNYTLLLAVQAITDEAGSPLRYEQSRERHYLKLKIWVPGATNATRTIAIRYRVRNGLKFLDEHDELYWNVTGDEWRAPIHSASAHIELPAGVTGLRATAFTGVYGSRGQETSTDVGERDVTIRTTRRLNFREGLTVAVAWDPGFVRRPGPLARLALFLRGNWMFGIPLVVFVVMFWLWFTRGRDPRRRPIASRYAPPEGLTPAELGTLVDNSPDMRDVTATLVDLAVRGYLLIEEKEARKFLGLVLNKEYVFKMRKPESSWGELQPHERTLLDELFTGGARDSVTSEELENSFYSSLSRIRDDIFSCLLDRRYYASRPDKIKKIYGGAGILIGIFIAVVCSLIANALGQSLVPAIGGGIVSSAIIIGFGWFMPARTVRGTLALEGVLGFEEFLGRVEADRLQRMVKTPEMFEKYLPHAMALGVEKNWARAFERIYRQSPDWYHGTRPHVFHTRSFVSDLRQMTTRTAGSMASSPRSSGGSGFGGGGFSGGGMGGGGGSGF
jgi:uncharacterized membrane protein